MPSLLTNLSDPTDPNPVQLFVGSLLHTEGVNLCVCVCVPTLM